MAYCMLAINTHSEYVILIAFPQQQWLHERLLMLRYTCIGCLVVLVTVWLAPVRWELVLRIMHVMFSLPMINYT